VIVACRPKVALDDPGMRAISGGNEGSHARIQMPGGPTLSEGAGPPGRFRRGVISSHHTSLRRHPIFLILC
jgi:hypothetical protein